MLILLDLGHFEDEIPLGFNFVTSMSFKIYQWRKLAIYGTPQCDKRDDQNQGRVIKIISYFFGLLYRTFT